MSSTTASVIAYVEDDFLLRQRNELDDIGAAVRRLDAGTYGACRTCRRPIPVARLEAVPEATQCVSCASGSIVRR